MANKNSDVKTVKRQGVLDAEKMKIEFFDDKTEDTYIYDISDPFKEFDGQNVLVNITIQVDAKEEKKISSDGQIG